ncbi:ABC transporter ATP-binding protein [Nocardioides litoris]|uniref:ABC transporter ATP-binding protein n=1 Tax=Nocardioides litoris TaxID=1926648 RepID=UPI00111D55D2|nr:ABC transporter ATP-binding protein [Nocardioides litoris]
MSTLTPGALPVATPAEARRRLATAVRPQRRGAAVAVGLLVASTVAGLVVPPVLGRLVDIGQAGGPRSALTVPLVVLAVAVLAQGVLAGLGRAALSRVGEGALARLRETVLGRALALPQERLEQGGTGDLASRVGDDVDRVSEALREGFPEFLFSGITVVLTVVGLAVLDWRFALAGLLSLPFHALAARLYLRASPPLYAAARRAEGVRSQQLVETVGGLRTVQALLLGTRHLDRVAARSEEARRAHLRAVDKSAWFFCRIHLGELVGTGSVLVMGAVLVGNGTASLGSATAAALYFLRLFDPVSALLVLLDEVQSATASLARLAGVASMEVAEPVGAPEPEAPVLSVRDVRFAYADGTEVLHGVDLAVAAGEHVAVVGSSGAGKTTLAALVAGIHSPAAGAIEVGGASVPDMGREELARHVTLVSQEVHVFAGTLAEDLRLADPTASDDDLVAALGVAGAGAWVRALPEGLDTRVGSGGHALTPVQAQQVAIARLVLRDADVAVLDEATAEAGSAGARVLEDGMRRALAGRTALLVAHRLTTAAEADRVVVLEAGRVVEEGPPAVLAAGDGPYARLWAAWSAARRDG